MPIEERYQEWLRRANAAAKDLKLDLEFKTTVLGFGYGSYESACVEITTTDTHEYLQVEGYTCIDGSGDKEADSGGKL